jgi:hypothetical protein
MSQVGQLAARVLHDLVQGRIVPFSDQMRMPYLAHRDEVTLSIENIARHSLARESEMPMRVSMAGHEGTGEA